MASYKPECEVMFCLCRVQLGIKIFYGKDLFNDDAYANSLALKNVVSLQRFDTVSE